MNRWLLPRKKQLWMDQCAGYSAFDWALWSGNNGTVATCVISGRRKKRRKALTDKTALHQRSIELSDKTSLIDKVRGPSGTLIVNAAVGRPRPVTLLRIVV